MVRRFFLSGRHVLDALTLDLRALQHRRDQFLLVAQNLGFLHLDLALFLHLLHLHLLGGHLLQHDVGLQFVRLVGRGLLPAALLGILRLLDLEVALRLGLPRLRSRLGNHPLLVSLRLGHGRFAQSPWRA